MNSNIKNLKAGFTIIELLVSLAVFSFILLVIVSFLFWMSYSNSRSKSDSEALDNAKRLMETITYEIRGSKSIYTPTTISTQLSLETSRYLPAGETTTYIDFFVCGVSLCLKKESQNPIPLLPDSAKLNAVSFTQISNGSTSSIQVNLTVASNDANSASANLVSTVALRTY